MPSQRKSSTARANGAKSRGPLTLEGRARSSHNSLRHGLSAQAVVLPAESQEDFEHLRQSYLDQFHPSTAVEMDLVETMAVARWRLLRLWSIETDLLSTELVRRADAIDAEFDDMGDGHRLAWVFQNIADNQHSLALLVRYEGALSRAYDRAFKQLQLLQRPRQNEPIASVPSPARKSGVSPAPQNPPHQNEPTRSAHGGAGDLVAGRNAQVQAALRQAATPLFPDIMEIPADVFVVKRAIHARTSFRYDHKYLPGIHSVASLTGDCRARSCRRVG